MRSMQWRRQKGADGARAPPFVFHELQTSLNHLICQSILHCTAACVVTRPIVIQWKSGQGHLLRMLTADEK